MAELEETDISEDFLREEWAAHVVQQTKPSPRQSKKLANKLIQEILELKDDTSGVKAELYNLPWFQLENMIMDGRLQMSGGLDTPPHTPVGLQMDFCFSPAIFSNFFFDGNTAGC